MVWHGCFRSMRFDGKSIEWITEDDVTELHDGPANGVRSIIEDKDGYFSIPCIVIMFTKITLLQKTTRIIEHFTVEKKA